MYVCIYTYASLIINMYVYIYICIQTYMHDALLPSNMPCNSNFIADSIYVCLCAYECTYVSVYV